MCHMRKEALAWDVGIAFFEGHILGLSVDDSEINGATRRAGLPYTYRYLYKRMSPVMNI